MAVIRKGLTLDPEAGREAASCPSLEWTGDPFEPMPYGKGLPRRQCRSCGGGGASCAIGRRCRHASGSAAAGDCAPEACGRLTSRRLHRHMSITVRSMKELFFSERRMQRAETGIYSRLWRFSPEQRAISPKRCGCTVSISNGSASIATVRCAFADLLFVQGRWQDSYAELQRIPRSDIPRRTVSGIFMQAWRGSCSSPLKPRRLTGCCFRGRNIHRGVSRTARFSCLQKIPRRRRETCHGRVPDKT